ncbi:MAG TPA: TRAP transporter small permease subunit [Syntrophales bacterium]|nr:TRAP transporter small permease subunit [Syntrophales bacterium]HOL59281.1 TRAP transporter small permease subunit [Syntrophales bacterium]HPO35331.1 TRAP transporter small permease subunit [Syntrophales bacterium]
MTKMLRIIDLVNEYVGKTVSFLLIAILIIILYEIFVRYVFNSPTIWAHELSQMIFGVYVILLGGYLQIHDGHVNVELIYGKFSPRVRAIVDMFTWLVFFAFAGVLTVKGWQIAWDSFQFRETEPTAFAPPIYPVKMMIPLGAFLLFLQGLARYLRALDVLIRGKEGGK